MLRGILCVAIVALMFWLSPWKAEFFPNKQLIYFYSSHCPYCTSFDPIWNQFVMNMNASFCDVDLLKVNGNSMTASYYDINSFPSIIGIKNGKIVAQMSEPYSYQNLLGFYTYLRTI